LLSLAAVVAVAAFFVAFYSSHTFRFRFVPPVNDRFTVEGYTLFSLKHLADMFNLLILLVPGIIVLLSVIIVRPGRKIFASTENRFLFIMILSAWLIIFMLDPKLGMPRDWDLFAFAGPATAVFLYLNILNASKGSRFAVAAVSFSILLGFYGLIPRALILTDHDKSLTQLRRYFVLDRQKNRPVRLALINYLKDRGENEQANIELANINLEYPEEAIVAEARKVYTVGNYEYALRLYMQVIDIDPLYWNAWSDIGTCLSWLGRHDEALEYFLIADAMNPGNVEITANIGWTYYRMDDPETALKYWKKSREMNPVGRTALDGLIAYHRRKRNLDKYLYYLREMVRRDDALPGRLKEMAEFHLSMNNYDSAAAYYLRGVSAGLDTMLVIKMMEAKPLLKEKLIERTNALK
jgi:tetratricopeptide (TPR) repeat protein